MVTDFKNSLHRQLHVVMETISVKKRTTNLLQLVSKELINKLCEFSGNEKFSHFSVVFYRCGCVAESMENFEKAGDWQMTFALSAQLGHDKGQRSQLARKMAGEQLYVVAHTLSLK